MPATLTTPARFGLIDQAGHPYRGLSFGSERAAGQYLDRQAPSFRRMLRTAGYRVGPVESPAPAAVVEPETPVVESRPTHKAKGKPADTCTLTLSIQGTDYRVRGIRADAFGSTARAYQLRKTGTATVYHVAETVHGSTCDCADQTFRHEGIDDLGCKHLKALRALGLIR
jgi:hypothetical protein